MNSTNTNNDSNSANCQEAYNVINDAFAQVARSIFLALLFIQFLLQTWLAIQYKRSRIALHGNLKLLYLILFIVFAINASGFLIIELRNTFLAIFLGTNSQICAMQTPVWYSIIFRGLTDFHLSIPLLHFTIMLERMRATRMAHRYEGEGRKFGVKSVIAVFTSFVAFLLIKSYLALSFYNWDPFTLITSTSSTTENNNWLSTAVSYFSAFLVIPTAAGDVYLSWKNKEMKKSNKLAKNSYNLSEKYQLEENQKAMSLILPLDIAYLFFMFLFHVLQIVVRTLPSPPKAVYLAYYNLILCLLVLYTIISLIFYRRFLVRNSTTSGNVRYRRNVVMDQSGTLYFEQLDKQWNRAF